MKKRKEAHVKGKWIYFLFCAIVQVSCSKNAGQSANELVCVGMHDNYCVGECLGFGPPIVPLIGQRIQECGLYDKSAGRTAYVLGTIGSMEARTLLAEMCFKPDNFPNDRLYIKAAGALGLSFYPDANSIQGIWESLREIRKNLCVGREYFPQIPYDMTVLAASKLDDVKFKKEFNGDLKEKRQNSACSRDILFLAERLALLETQEVFDAFSEEFHMHCGKNYFRFFQHDSALRFFRAALYVDAVHTKDVIKQYVLEIQDVDEQLACIQMMRLIISKDFRDFHEVVVWFASNDTWSLPEDTRKLLRDEIQREKRIWFVNGFNGARPFEDDCETFASLRNKRSKR